MAWSGRPAEDYLREEARRAVDADPRVAHLVRVVLAKGPRHVPHVREAARAASMDARSLERWMHEWAGFTWREFIERWRVGEAAVCKKTPSASAGCPERMRRLLQGREEASRWTLQPGRRAFAS
jgi:hypothetical protein